MGKQAAKGPVFSRAQLIDRRMEVVSQIEALTILKDQLAEQIVADMTANNLTKALGTKGKGYQLIGSLKSDYRPEVIAAAEKMRLTHLFTPPPKVTRSKVLAALKADKLTHTQYNELESFAGPTYTEHTLKTYEEKQA